MACCQAKEFPGDWQYQFGDVVDGVVTTVKPYAIHIKVDDVVGVLHISQFSSTPVKSMYEVFKVCVWQPFGWKATHGSCRGPPPWWLALNCRPRSCRTVCES